MRKTILTGTGCLLMGILLGAWLDYHGWLGLCLPSFGQDFYDRGRGMMRLNRTTHTL